MPLPTPINVSFPVPGNTPAVPPTLRRCWAAYNMFGARYTKTVCIEDNSRVDGGSGSMAPAGNNELTLQLHVLRGQVSAGQMNARFVRTRLSIRAASIRATAMLMVALLACVWLDAFRGPRPRDNLVGAGVFDATTCLMMGDMGIQFATHEYLAVMNIFSATLPWRYLG